MLDLQWRPKHAENWAAWLLPSLFWGTINYSAKNYMLKVIDRITRKRCETYPKLTTKTPGQKRVSIVDFEQVNVK